MVKYPKPLSSFFPTSSSSVLLVIFLILLLKSFWPLCSKGLCLNPSLQIIHFLFFSYTFITIILMKFQLLWLYFRDRFTQVHLSPDVWHGAICTYLVVTQLRKVSKCVCEDAWCGLWQCPAVYYSSQELMKIDLMHFFFFNYKKLFLSHPRNSLWICTAIGMITVWADPHILEITNCLGQELKF